MTLQRGLMAWQRLLSFGPRARLPLAGLRQAPSIDPGRLLLAAPQEQLHPWATSWPQQRFYSVGNSYSKDTMPRSSRRTDGDSRSSYRDSEDGPLQRRPQRRCPFTVHRTGSDNLPVYVYRRNNRSQVVTVIRKVKGNQEELRKELVHLCRSSVIVGREGYLEIMGHHRRAVKAYLRSIGY
mmetsp:Transcript_59860/g.129743  ORF Transcript_59860/g.129743 Transcript_59860/m.129743 type:complete len:181 (+) Transcript_59860:129-671(+)